MTEEVLFEMTKEHLETGLRGVPVGYCTTSYVDPLKGLIYAGEPIAELVDWDPEAVIYLLYMGREGSREEVGEFSKALKKRAACAPEAIYTLQALPRSVHPMELFESALLILGMFESCGDYREDGLNLIAKVPHLAAAVINHHAGWGATPPPRDDLGYIENFVQMLQVPSDHRAELTRAFRLFNILHLDHGGGNLSTFVGKAVASGLEDMYGSICSAMCALAGPRHGRANQDCLEFVRSAASALGKDPTPEKMQKLIRERVARGEVIPGFGHAVLRVEDPRATVQYAFVKRHYPEHPLVKVALLLREEGSKVLAENPKISDPHPNVDAISGTLLTAAGFGYPEYYTVLFGLSRSVGIALQIIYERLEARSGKGTPIIRPRYLYKARSSSEGSKEV